jgi:hypothetical protein
MRRVKFAGCVLAACIAAAPVAQSQGVAPSLTAAAIVEKNAAARGGVDAWRKMQTMAWAGHSESANAPGRRLPFLLEQKRPDQTRFEILAAGQRSVRVFDGTRGWKMRSSISGKPETQAYSDDELRFARGAQAIEGPLMDYVAKGGAITLGGFGSVDGRKAYILEVALPSGGHHRVWVDAATFLEARHDREVRNVNGHPAMATVFYRDYREFEGLQIPLTIETGSAAGERVNKLVVERVALNPKLDDETFARPGLPASRRSSVVVDTRVSSAGASPPTR